MANVTMTGQTGGGGSNGEPIIDSFVPTQNNEVYLGGLPKAMIISVYLREYSVAVNGANLGVKMVKPTIGSEFIVQQRRDDTGKKIELQVTIAFTATGFTVSDVIGSPSQNPVPFVAYM